jgi:hypothetical protein
MLINKEWEMDNGNNGATSDQQTDSNTSDIIKNVRRQAFEALVPLIDQVDGSPEQKFSMIMNALRVSHDATLLEKAFGAVQQISDSGLRAEALIDIINEANYQLDYPSTS